MSVRKRAPWLAAVTVAGGLLFGLTGTADAVVLDNDRPKLTTKGFDFGLNWDGFGAPLNGGNLDWDVTNGIVTPELSGNLYLKNVSGQCAKIQVVYYDGHDFVDLEESAVHCAPDNGRHTYAIDIEPVGDGAIDHVHVKINTLGNNGVWQTAAEQGWNLG